MLGLLRQRPTQRSSTTPICPAGGDGTGRWLCFSFSAMREGIASLSFRALNAVSCATNATVVTKCGTK